MRLRQFKAAFVTKAHTYPNVHSDLIKETKLFAYIIHFFVIYTTQFVNVLFFNFANVSVEFIFRSR